MASVVKRRRTRDGEHGQTSWQIAAQVNNEIRIDGIPHFLQVKENRWLLHVGKVSNDFDCFFLSTSVKPEVPARIDSSSVKSTKRRPFSHTRVFTIRNLVSGTGICSTSGFRPWRKESSCCRQTRQFMLSLRISIPTGRVPASSLARSHWSHCYAESATAGNLLLTFCKADRKKIIEGGQ